jgi:hypothetical protein
MKKRATHTVITVLILVAVSAWLSAGQQQLAAADVRAIECGLAYQGRSTRLLSKRSAELMLTKAAEFTPGFGVPVGQGLGVMLLGEGRTLHFLHPGGNDPGANCWVIMSPVTGKGAVIMTNAAPGGALMLELLASIAHHGGWPDLSQR